LDDYEFLGSMVVASSNLVWWGTLTTLSTRAMTMHDKANFTIAPRFFYNKLKINYLKKI
jgi:hypothetical protein